MNVEHKSNNTIYSLQSESKVFEVYRNKINNLYPVAISFPSSDCYVDISSGFIDTGASNSIITTAALYKEISPTRDKILNEAEDRADAYIKVFSSVNGKDDVIGRLCKLPSIIINDYEIVDFPFYLIHDKSSAKILIGNDFITSCDLVQKKDQYMVFYDFDMQSMMLKMESNKMLDLLVVE